MPQPARRSELGRGERVLPGVWRLRLPLPYPGVPHCNAWAVAAGDGIVLFDTGMHEPGSMGHLQRAMEQVHLRLEQVRLIVCTHGHPDHFGQAGTIVDRTGCEVWMHHDHGHVRGAVEDPDAAWERRIEIARHSGVPEEPLRAYAQARREAGSGLSRFVEPARDLVDGVEVETDLGRWRVTETPGHAPSHVCFFHPERRLLISGDHLLGRVSPYYDFGHTPDPAGEFLDSLERVEALDARLCLPGHGRTFTDVQAHIEANRRLVSERLGLVLAAVREHAPITAFDVVPHVYGERVTAATAAWWLTETLSYLTHLERLGHVERHTGEADTWVSL
ncbi:MAG TPA: MBL fold metallo-hydrolase [Solirubrobacteraceae bacterium]|nr:MBL fold metallo-hydrolase [Solirubrobacteraceae bacterium]